jgi:hypothetical protein
LGPETPQTTIEEIEVERINANEFLYINSSPLTKPRNVRPLYVADYRGLKVYGDVEITADIDLTYVKQPAKVEWKYQMVLGEALYDSSFSVNFELHASEETELVIKILELASLAAKDLQVNQIATQEEIRNTQQEKS